MKEVYGVTFKSDSKEEDLPGFDESFPCISTCYSFREGQGAPWHWHKAVELFYVESGSIEYITPTRRYVFPTGWAGMVNSNMLHMTEGKGRRNGRQLLHLFDPLLIAGTAGSRIEERYIRPLVSAAQPELIALDPEIPDHRETIRQIRESFLLPVERVGYELRIRTALSEIWLRLLEIAAPNMRHSAEGTVSEQLKRMLGFVHENYGERVTAKELAAEAYISERSCFALFKTYLRTTPAAYIQSYRLQAAKRLLAQSDGSITGIADACGFGSSSHFSSVFRKEVGIAPHEYRKCCREGKVERV